MFHDSPLLLNISYHNEHPPKYYFVSVKTNMLEKGRRLDSSQFIPTRWGKHSPAFYFELQIIYIKKKPSQVSTTTACSNVKAHGKVPPWLMRPKSETSNFELLAPSKVISYFRKNGTHEKVSAIDFKIGQLQKSGTVFQPSRISPSVPLRRLSRVGKQYTKVLGKYDTWSPAYPNFWRK